MPRFQFQFLGRLFIAGVITAFLAVGCFAKDHKIEIKNVGELCILEAEHVGDWAGIAPATIELWQDPSGKFCAVPTNVSHNNKIIIECIMWEAKRRDRWFVTIGRAPPEPPVPPTPPNVVVPNKFGIGEVAHREALKVANRSKIRSLIDSLRQAANEMKTVQNSDEVDAVYDRHKRRMDTALGAEWMPLRVATQNAFFQAWADQKIKNYADQSAALTELADAISLVK